MQTVYVRPAEDADGRPLLVRQPDRGWMPLPPEGEWVLLDEYWARRLRDRDVSEAEPPPPPDQTERPVTAAPTPDPESPSDAAPQPRRRA
jgi:hypothetical protein